MDWRHQAVRCEVCAAACPLYCCLLQVDAAFDYLLKSADVDRPDVWWVGAVLSMQAVSSPYTLHTLPMLMKHSVSEGSLSAKRLYDALLLG